MDCLRGAKECTDLRFSCGLIPFGFGAAIIRQPRGTARSQNCRSPSNAAYGEGEKMFARDLAC